MGSTSTFLGVKLDRLLKFCHHLVALCEKLFLCVTLLKQLVGSGWGAGVKTLRTVPYLWSTQQLGTGHQSDVAALTLAS